MIGKLVIENGVKLLYTVEDNVRTMYHIDDINFPEEFEGARFKVKFLADKNNRVGSQMDVMGNWDHE